MCDEVLFDGPLTDLKALLQSGQVLLDHPSAALHPLFIQSSKNHFISSVHCGCSPKWITKTTCSLIQVLYSCALQGTITPKTNFSFSSSSLSSHWRENFRFSNRILLFFSPLLFRCSWLYFMGFTLKRIWKKETYVDPNREMCWKHPMHQRLAQSFGS